ncbi:hypothetical protein COT60_03385 [Candidatus Pacearchaeota archaeon CG09_land_8_20_14_0_10_30_9]|nr:MAG: hypothetical protein COV77_01880 [Candidatus Pacearchaeota archaeon CG11_big_fil_rev_8_21_14_0_20_30_13]PIO00889.1 MAG: hypothetical protein COT60_03385 [Candidatus Pacearchaeota archaeon CG09_land_8_20_14_0_10_30_9]
MIDLMNWRVCERDFIKRVEPDRERIDSIKKMAIKRFEKLKRDKFKEDEISFLVEGYYEVIKELLVAYLLKEGMRSKNHQCLITYFYKTHPELENEVDLIGQMSFFRNRLGYYGEKVPEEFYNNRKGDFDKIVKILLNFINE